VILKKQDLKKQILFASPNIHLLLMMSFLLVADGFTVFLENEIWKAIESLEWRRPDFVLLDLPDINSEFSGAFSAFRKMQSPPPLVFLVEPQFVYPAKQWTLTGNHEFIAKPIDYQEIRKHLRFIAAPVSV